MGLHEKKEKEEKGLFRLEKSGENFLFLVPLLTALSKNNMAENGLFPFIHSF